MENESGSLTEKEGVIKAIRSRLKKNLTQLPPSVQAYGLDWIKTEGLYTAVLSYDYSLAVCQIHDDTFEVYLKRPGVQHKKLATAATWQDVERVVAKLARKYASILPSKEKEASPMQLLLLLELGVSISEKLTKYRAHQLIVHATTEQKWGLREGSKRPNYPEYENVRRDRALKEAAEKLAREYKGKICCAKHLIEIADCWACIRSAIDQGN